MSRPISFPAILDAARSVSSWPGYIVRRMRSSLRAVVACFVTEATLIEPEVLDADTFQPVSRMAERLLEAVLMARMAEALRSMGVGSVALAFPLALEMVSLVASLSARSSGETTTDLDFEVAARELFWRAFVACMISERCAGKMAEWQWTVEGMKVRDGWRLRWPDRNAYSCHQPHKRS